MTKYTGLLKKVWRKFFVIIYKSLPTYLIHMMKYWLHVAQVSKLNIDLRKILKYFDDLIKKCVEWFFFLIIPMWNLVGNRNLRSYKTLFYMGLDGTISIIRIHTVKYWIYNRHFHSWDKSNLNFALFNIETSAFLC